MTLASSRSGSLSLIQKFTNSKGGRTTQGDEVGMGSSLLPDPGALLNYRTFIRWHVFFCIITLQLKTSAKETSIVIMTNYLYFHGG